MCLCVLIVNDCVLWYGVICLWCVSVRVFFSFVTFACFACDVLRVMCCVMLYNVFLLVLFVCVVNLLSWCAYEVLCAGVWIVIVFFFCLCVWDLLRLCVLLVVYNVLLYESYLCVCSVCLCLFNALV